jgi:oligoribonuclease NrnB/cAMP/cGMP phosphodiesterase (DHH superfamily)
MIKKILIISHRDADGITAAVSYIWNYLEINNISKNIKHIYKYADIIDFEYGENLDLIFKKKKINLSNYRQVVVLDLNIGLDKTISLYKKFKENLIWIDHHKRPDKDIAKELIKKKIKISGIRDHKHAACFLVWKFFNKGAPEFVKYIQDMDLWTFKLENSTYFIAGLINLKEKYNRKNIKYILDLLDFDNFNLNKPKIIDKGKIIHEHEKKHILSLIPFGKIIKFYGKKAFIINTNFFSSSFAEVLFNLKNKKYKDVEIFIIWNKIYDTNKYKFSLRKRKNSNTDLSLIAKEYGGGGHPAAAAFHLDDISKFKYD